MRRGGTRAYQARSHRADAVDHGDGMMGAIDSCGGFDVRVLGFGMMGAAVDAVGGVAERFMPRL